MRFAMPFVMNPVGAFAGKADLGDMCMGDDAQVWPFSSWLQVSFFGGKAKPVFLRNLIIAKAILTGAIIVMIARIPKRFSSINHHIQRFILRANRCHIQWTPNAAKGAVKTFITFAELFAVFGFAEIG